MYIFINNNKLYISGKWVAIYNKAIFATIFISEALCYKVQPLVKAV